MDRSVHGVVGFIPYCIFMTEGNLFIASYLLKSVSVILCLYTWDAGGFQYNHGLERSFYLISRGYYLSMNTYEYVYHTILNTSKMKEENISKTVVPRINFRTAPLLYLRMRN